MQNAFSFRRLGLLFVRHLAMYKKTYLWLAVVLVVAPPLLVKIFTLLDLARSASVELVWFVFMAGWFFGVSIPPITMLNELTDRRRRLIEGTLPVSRAERFAMLWGNSFLWYGLVTLCLCGVLWLSAQWLGIAQAGKILRMIQNWWFPNLMPATVLMMAMILVGHSLFRPIWSKLPGVLVMVGVWYLLGQASNLLGLPVGSASSTWTMAIACTLLLAVANYWILKRQSIK